MAQEDTPNQVSGNSQSPIDDPPVDVDDAVLRNLSELMSNEEMQKASAQQRTSHDFAKEQNSSVAAELRRSKRLKGPSPPGESELEVIFDEDAGPEDPQTPNETECTSGADNDPPPALDPPTPQMEATAHWIKNKFSLLELSAFATLIAALLCATLIMGGTIMEGIAFFRKAAPPEYSPPPNVVSGQLVELSGIRSHWRDRREDDRVQEGSHILPVIRIESGKGTGSLQIIFRDEYGRIQGDTHTFSMAPNLGKQEGNVVEINALCTSGIANELQFTDYRLAAESNMNECWTVSFLESLDGEKWELIGKYKLAPDRL